MTRLRFIAPLVGTVLALQALCLNAQGAARDLVLMLDNSGSMVQNDPEFLINDAVRAFVRDISGDIHVAIIIFDERVTVAVPLTALNDDSREQLLRSLDQINYKGQLTNSPAAMERAIYELSNKGRPNAEKSIIFMTDGIVDVEGGEEVDLDKKRWMQDELAAQAAEENIRIFGIAFTDNADYQLMQSLAQKTRASYYRANTTQDVEEVFAGLADKLGSGIEPAIADELPAPPAVGDSGLEPLELAQGEPGLPTLPEPSEEAEPGATVAPVEDTLAADTGEEGTDDLAALLGLTDEDTAQSPELDTEAPDLALPGESLFEEAPGETPGEVPDDGLSVVQIDTGESPGVQAPQAGDELPPPPAPPPGPALPLIAIAVGLVAIVAMVFALIVILKSRRKPGAAGAEAPHAPQAFLNDLGGVTPDKSYELNDRVSIVGRIAGHDEGIGNWIVIEENTIGRRHAVVEYKNHGYWVSDQNSLNGTFVNGERISAERQLKHGDKVKFYKYEFEFVMPDMYGAGITVFQPTTGTGAGVDDDEDDDATQVKGATAAMVEDAAPDDDATEMNAVPLMNDAETEVRAPQPDDVTEVNPGSQR